MRHVRCLGEWAAQFRDLCCGINRQDRQWDGLR